MSILCFVAIIPVLYASPKPHLVMILQDDLGHYDVGWNNPDNLNISGNITNMAKEGVILSAHYVHYWCSPTRRSFLTGRLPIHHGEMLSDFATDDIDLRWSIISQKLKPAGYKSYWIGKGHTGYKSMAHLPTHRSFEEFIGFMHGAQSYRSAERWHNELPYNKKEYSTTLFGDFAINILQQHNASIPLFMYLPWQAVHSPYDSVPGWTGKSTYRGMLWAADAYIGKLEALLKEKGMWENTLIVYSADNGGRGDGINYPLRGEKRTNFEGGMRSAAFVSGGILPSKIRGTTNNIRMHVVDWYPTFCRLAGVDAKDDPPVPPLPVDPTNPHKDIYGNESYPSIDGVDVWDMLLQPNRHNVSSAHPTLILTREVIISGDTHKLMVAQRGNTHQHHDNFENGWRYPNSTWITPSNWTCGLVSDTWEKTHFVPCLFNLKTDLREEKDLSKQNPQLLHDLWLTLNNSWLTHYHARSPSTLVGPCNSTCSKKHWMSMGAISPGNGPICSVPGCE